jgi:hypothetical protein
VSSRRDRCADVERPKRTYFVKIGVAWKEKNKEKNGKEKQKD